MANEMLGWANQGFPTQNAFYNPMEGFNTAPVMQQAPMNDWATYVPSAASPTLSWWDQAKANPMGTLFGGQNEQGNFQSGIVSPMLGGMGALFQGWSGLQQSKLAKDALNFQKLAFQTNLANQTQAYNTQLEDQYKARTSNYAGKDEDVAKYMAEHGMKG